MSEHGGHTNAYTSNESTNYHFDVNWDALEPALDRCPLAAPALPCMRWYDLHTSLARWVPVLDRPEGRKVLAAGLGGLPQGRPPDWLDRHAGAGASELSPTHVAPALLLTSCPPACTPQPCSPHLCRLNPGRFAQFFICPLISPDGVDREAKAVDSE